MAFEAKELFDALADFPQGMNAGVAPLRVPREQLAYLGNGTVRGTFARHRPAFKKITMDYGGDSALQTHLETGQFQGACYYKPDFGLESLLAQISGRLFQFRISGTTATVFDQSIVNDLNSATNAQAWLWQSEKWAICNDGQNLPIFFDGNASRRSGGSAGVNNTIGVTFTAPAVGSTVATTFGSTFSGPFNAPMFVSAGVGSSTKYLFEAVGTGTVFSGYPVTLKNLGNAGTIEAQGSQVIVKNNVVGVTAAAKSSSTASSSVTIPLTAPPVNAVVGSVVNVPFSVGVKSGTITSIDFLGGFNQITVHFATNVPGPWSLGAGQNITNTSTDQSLVALLYSSYTAPGVQASSTAYLDRAYAGAIPQLVYINDQQFQITAIATPTSSTQIVLLNINAPTTASLFTAGSNVTSPLELPAGRMGAYGLGRNWMSLTDGRSFVAGDIVGGSSGVAAYAFRDAVLKVTENTYLNGGGTFVVPGQIGDIRAMIFPAKLDASLGQGSLMVYTPRVAFSCNTPTDRNTWQDVTNPILTESVKGGGASGQNSTVNVNSDVHSRDANGILSTTLARRDYNTWGITPISREVQPTLDADDKSLLEFGSAISFDNRELRTASPVQSPLGVYHTKLVVLNFDPISSLRGKAPTVYDAVWTDLNVLQLVTGSFNGKDRALAFCVSADLSKIELWEILPSDGPDSATADEGGVPIVMDLQSGSLNFGQPAGR
jgi:hypothetical protein